MQFDDVTREAIEVIQSLFRIATVRVADIFDIKINSKKDVFGRKDMIENGYSAIFFSDISRKYDIIIKNIESRIPKELFEISNKMSENDILVNLAEFSKNNTGRAVLYVGTGKVALNGYVAVLTLKESFKNMINLKYISFYMNYSNFFRQQVLKKATGARVQRISKQDFELMEIKVPGIETQEKVIKNFESIKKDFEIVSASIENKIEKITLAKSYFMQEIFNKIEEEE
nr:MAG TPA: hypothetical protein [Caudoviricetes sp.]